METLEITRWVHILSGFTAFFAAPAALIARKGGASHFTAGRIFFWAMAISTGTAFINSLFIWIPFLLMLSVFSFYNVFAGYRAIRFYRGEKPGRTDHIIHAVAIGFSAALFGYGIYGYTTSPENYVWVLAIVFGGLGMFGITKNYRMIFKPQDRATWLRFHISGMLSGYIAAVTAFSATSLDFLPGLVQWLWPTVLFVPIISWHQRRVGKLAMTTLVALLFIAPNALRADNSSSREARNIALAPKKTVLTITITTAKNSGKIYMSLMNEKNEEVDNCMGEVIDGRVVCTFEGLAPGKYAARAYQDLNDDGEMNANMFGMPVEPYGFSNDARGQFGPPSFDDQLFDFEKDLSITFKLL